MNKRLTLSVGMVLSMMLSTSWSAPDTASSGGHTYFEILAHAGLKAQNYKELVKNEGYHRELETILSSLHVGQAKLLNFNHDDHSKDGLSEYVSVVMESLQALTIRSGANSTSTCANDTARVLTSWFDKTQKWSLQFLDAAGKIVPGVTLYRINFVGNYKQCRAARAPDISPERKGFKGNYCTLYVTLGGSSPLFALAVQLGACMPDTCTEEETSSLTQELVSRLTNGTFQNGSAQCHTDEREMTTATKVSIAVLVIIGTLMLLGTAFDIIFIQRPKWLQEVDEASLLTNVRYPENKFTGAADQDNGAVGPADETTLLLAGKPARPSQSRASGVLSQTLLAFSVYTNGSKVLNTYQPPGSLGAVHGIRFLSMTWIIFCHTYIFGISFISNAFESFPELLKRWTFDPIANGFVSVDTFFTLSGLLTAYLTIKEMRKHGWKINWPLFYFHRFWRLTPPYMLTLLLVLGFMQYLGSGALWSNLEPADKENCEKYWWANLLYVNNLIDSKYMCFGHSWYLSNDMQFFVLSPLMLIPFYFNVVAGVVSCSVFLLINFISAGVLSNQNSWPVTLVSMGAGSNVSTIMGWFDNYYKAPWCRIGAFVVGILAGYLLAVNNGRIKMDRYVAILGWLVAVATGLAIVYGIHGDISGDSPTSVGLAAFYNAVSRSAWAACVSWVIIACVSGYGGPVNTLLSWSPFVTLGRLTYMAYLIHPCLIYVYYQNLEQLYYLSDSSIVITFCGLLLCTYLISFVLMLAFESPMIGLEKTFLHKKHKE
ncbi:unnamed protein product [Lymnaea stagnalis]|uniref:Nose resistant-to-fluoxetine protein N-terminal domain-containing protein n=1 Tax=Lymnaea stagnalis TaxID=6523 RepID=A0AAV2IIW1_LYMST